MQGHGREARRSVLHVFRVGAGTHMLEPSPAAPQGLHGPEAGVQSWREASPQAPWCEDRCPPTAAFSLSPSLATGSNLPWALSPSWGLSSGTSWHNPTIGFLHRALVPFPGGRF